MKIEGRLMSKGGEEVLDSSAPTHRQYVCCVLNVHTSQSEEGREKTKRRVDYVPTTKAAKWLSAGQLLLGAIVLGLQLAPTFWHMRIITRMQHLPTGEIYRVDNNFSDDVADFVGPGIWFGIYMLVTGTIGLVASVRKVKCLIITHLIMNILGLAVTIALIISAVVSVAALMDCKTRGKGISASFSMDESQAMGSSDTPHRPILYAEEYGERIAISSRSRWSSNGEFYCKSELFTVWVTLEGAMIVSALTTFGVLITLIVRNSLALCQCCRDCSRAAGEENEDEVMLVKREEVDS